MLIQEQQNNLRVRTVAPGDFSALAKLYTYSVRCNPNGFIQDLSFHESIQSICLNCLKNGGDMLAAKVDGQLVGMGGLRKVSRDRAELCKLHIYPVYQGNGYGKQLTKRLLVRAGELDFHDVELHVTKTQIAAIHLYRQLGFTEIKENIYLTELNGKKYSFDTVYMEIRL